MAEIDRLELNVKAQELRESLGVDEESPIDIFIINLIYADKIKFSLK